jgi:hypothetical protein
MSSKPKQFDDDDGRVICDMDVEGLGWKSLKARREMRPDNAVYKSPRGEQLSRSEARRYNWYAILAGLVIVAVFSVTWILFVLFCTQIWFK